MAKFVTKKLLQIVDLLCASESSFGFIVYGVFAPPSHMHADTTPFFVVITRTEWIPKLLLTVSGHQSNSGLDQLKSSWFIPEGSCACGLLLCEPRATYISRNDLGLVLSSKTIRHPQVHKTNSATLSVLYVQIQLSVCRSLTAFM